MRALTNFYVLVLAVLLIAVPAFGSDATQVVASQKGSCTVSPVPSDATGTDTILKPKVPMSQDALGPFPFPDYRCCVKRDRRDCGWCGYVVPPKGKIQPPDKTKQAAVIGARETLLV